MNICSLNFNSVKFNRLNATHQNPICFKGNEQKDSFSSSEIEQNKKLMTLLSDEEFAKLSPQKRFALVQKLNYIINLDSKTYANLSPSAKIAIKSQLDKIKIDFYGVAINNSKNNSYLAKFENFYVASEKELETLYGISDCQSLFEGCTTEEIGNKSFILIPKEDTTLQIFQDIKNKKVASHNTISKNLNCVVQALPFAYKKYSQDNEAQKIDYTFIDLENEFNQGLLNSSSRFRQYLSELPFEYTKTPWGSFVDINNPKNIELVKNAHPLYPQKSQYYYGALNWDESIKIDIPVKYLETLGFSKENILIDLIKNGKLDGKMDSNGEYHVHIDTRHRLGENKNLDVLNLLRKQNPKIKTFKEVAKALNITHRRLEEAIFTGDFEIISEYTNESEKEARYCDITTPKNQEFIRKIKFEQEFEKSLKEEKRAQNEKIKIEKKDLKQRLNALRMALVWEFMPNTKAIASNLASKDGFITKLLIKEDDPNETLTQIEKAKINTYRKEIWLISGTQELKEAHRKANELMKTFRDYGICAIEEEYLPIFEKYGFTK